MGLYIIFTLVLLIHFIYAIWKIKKYLHLLQLNYYYTNRYIPDLVHFKSDLLIDLIPLFIASASFIPFIKRPLLLYIVGGLLISFYMVAFLFRKKIKEKKPLVFTARVKRIFSASLFLELGALGINAFLIYRFGNIVISWCWIGLALLTFLNPLLLLLGHFLMWPLEKGIQHFYFRKAQQKIKSMPQLLIIGITGSYGKTTTKYILHSLLQQKYRTLMTPESFNTPMGISKIIRSELKPVHEVFIVEMSAKKRGDIKEICDLVSPQWGLITAIGEQHLETFKDFETIKKTKNELIEALPLTGVAFFNADDESCRSLALMSDRKNIFYGLKDPLADYRVSSLHLSASGSSFTVQHKNEAEVLFETRLLGRHNVMNILAALAIASELGVPLQSMQYAVRSLIPVPHRLELKSMAQGITLIDDAFNANPIGSESALEVLKHMTAHQKIIVTPGLVELGPKLEEYNRRFGQSIAAICDYVVLVGPQKTAPILQGLKEKGFSDQKIFVAQNLWEANAHLKNRLQPGDIVLYENDLPIDR